jgi:hypothetical protein
MRIFLAGLLGGIAMFVWTSIAHMTPQISSVGISQIPNEAPVLAAMHDGIGAKPGLYLFPWVDPQDPKMMEKTAALTKTGPSGLLIYHPPGASTDVMAMLIGEFAKELAQALIAAFLLAFTPLAGYWCRVGFVTALGLFASLGTDTSYLIWYGFPLDYTLVYTAIGLIGAFAAGLVIALWMKPRTA